MKIPARILGLIVATVAAPIIAGCAGEVSDPDTNKNESNLQSEEPPKEQASQPTSAAPTAPAPPAETPESAPPEEPSQPEQPDDPCPPCGMG